MKYEIIGSSSKGNAIVVEDFMLLDCGVSYSKLKPYLNKIKLIFISHVHKDHFNTRTINQIIYNYPNIAFVTCSVYVVKKLALLKANYTKIFIPDIGKKYDLGGVIIKVERLYHDTPNYALKWEYDGKKGIYVVDTKRVDHINAKNYDLYLIESNYKTNILQRHIDECDDKNILQYLYRVPETHLSFENANDFLLNNMGKNSKYEYIHCSDYNYEKEII